MKNKRKILKKTITLILIGITFTSCISYYDPVALKVRNEKQIEKQVKKAYKRYGKITKIDTLYKTVEDCFNEKYYPAKYKDNVALCTVYFTIDTLPDVIFSATDQVKHNTIMWESWSTTFASDFYSLYFEEPLKDYYLKFLKQSLTDDYEYKLFLDQINSYTLEDDSQIYKSFEDYRKNKSFYESYYVVIRHRNDEVLQKICDAVFVDTKNAGENVSFDFVFAPDNYDELTSMEKVEKYKKIY